MKRITCGCRRCRSGFGLPAAFGAVHQLDAELGSRVPYAFHDEFGFLTACPTNVGTGMRASVLIHLPGLVLTKEMSKVLASLQQMGLTYRGLYGEGSDVVGNFFQISNQTTLGKSEEELLELLVRVVKTVIDREEDARRLLLRDAGYIIEDKVWRAYGTLTICTEPHVRRGDELSERRTSGRGIETDLRLKCIYSQQAPDISASWRTSAHAEGRALTESEANLARARYVRHTLANEATTRD